MKIGINLRCFCSMHHSYNINFCVTKMPQIQGLKSRDGPVVWRRAGQFYYSELCSTLPDNGCLHFARQYLFTHLQSVRVDLGLRQFQWPYWKSWPLLPVFYSPEFKLHLLVRVLEMTAESKSFVWGWGNVSIVRNTCCPWSGLGYGSQHPYGGSQSSVTLFRGIFLLSSVVSVISQCTYMPTYRQNIHLEKVH